MHQASDLCGFLNRVLAWAWFPIRCPHRRFHRRCTSPSRQPYVCFSWQAPGILGYLPKRSFSCQQTARRRKGDRQAAATTIDAAAAAIELPTAFSLAFAARCLVQPQPVVQASESVDGALQRPVVDRRAALPVFRLVLDRKEAVQVPGRPCLKEQGGGF